MNEEYSRLYRKEHKAEIALYAQGWYMDNKDRLKIKNQEYALKIKREVLTHYGLGGELHCVRCNESELDGLTLDHINGGGLAQRRLDGLHGKRLYANLKNSGFPEGYQALCGTCQLKKRIRESEWSNQHID